MDKDEVKKSPKANLEVHRNTFILMGLVVGLSLLFFAFEWSTQTRKLDETVLVQDVLAEEEIEITRREPIPPPPPPPEPAPEIIEVVEEKVETKLEIKTEDDQRNDRCKPMFRPTSQAKARRGDRRDSLW